MTDIPVSQQCKAEKDVREAAARAEHEQRRRDENFCRTLVQEAVEARPTGQAPTDYYDENGAFDSARCGKWLLHVRASAKSEEKMRFALDQAKRHGVPSDKVDAIVQDCENARRRKGK